jgi:hypothetical protein
MCERPATSLEHVPPRCIFPEAKDLGVDYRKSLITVPSCDTHNMEKSGDDEYLMMVLTCNIINNTVAMKQIETKILRAWERNPCLAELLLRVNRPVVANGTLTLACKVDFNRVSRSLDWLVRGLYYNEYKKKLLAELRIEIPAMLSFGGENAVRSNRIRSDIGAEVNRVLSNLPRVGENPNVFWYQISDNRPDRLMVNMVFFGCLQVFGLHRPRRV